MPEDSGYSSHNTHTSVKKEVTKNVDSMAKSTKSGLCPTCGQKVSASNVGGAAVGAS